MSSDLGKATEAELILQAFCHFTYVTAHSPTLPSLYLRHSSFSIPSVASPSSQNEQSSFYKLSVTLPTSQLSLQPYHCFTYVTAHSPNLLSLLLRHRVELILQRSRHFTYITAYSPTLPSLYIRHSSFSSHSIASRTSQLILQPFTRFSYVTEQSSFSNLSVTSPTSQLILQPFRRFTCVTARSPAIPLLHLRYSSFSNPSLASPTSQSRAHSPTFPSLHLRHSFSFLKLSVTSPTSQLILQPFHRFTYVTAYFPTLPLLYLRHSSFSNPSFVSPTSQAVHLIHLASRPWKEPLWRASIPGIYRIPTVAHYVTMTSDYDTDSRADSTQCTETSV